MKPDTDTAKYKIRLLDIAIYIPIAQLSQSVFAEYNSLLTRPKDNKAGAACLHFRRTEVRPVSIPVNAQEFYSGCKKIFRLEGNVGDFFVSSISLSPLLRALGNCASLKSPKNVVLWIHLIFNFFKLQTYFLAKNNLSD